MPRCVDCQHYPWRRDVDASLLPAMPCHPGSALRRWPEGSQRIEHDCRQFVALPEPAAPAAEAPASEAEAKAEPAEPPARPKRNRSRGPSVEAEEPDAAD